MKEENQYEILNHQEPEPAHQTEKPKTKTYIRHLILFVLTFISVSGMGALFVGQTAGIDSYLDIVLWEGVLFATLLLGFLAVHEFGHYFASVYHRISTSLPYFIPLPVLSPIGTLGAVIRIKDRIDDSKKLFDIGIAGPIAGFVVALIVLLIGFATLPDPAEYMQSFEGHESLNAYIDQHNAFPDQPLQEEGAGDVLVVGNTLLYDFLASFFENVPPMWEMYHYPFLFAGWLGLFFTALNLMPVGQLDGGHVLYSLIGYKKHLIFARVFFVGIVTLAGASLVPLLHLLLDQYDNPLGTVSWGIWAFALFFMLRKAFRGNMFWTLTAAAISLICSAVLIYGIFGPEGTDRFMPWVFWSLFVLFLVGIEHPPVMREQELGTGRKILGWLSILIFILCISPNPFYLQ